MRKEDFVKDVIQIIQDNFPHGIRRDFIDTCKVLRIYSESVSCGFVCESSELLRRSVADVIRRHGIEQRGRFYFLA